MHLDITSRISLLKRMEMQCVTCRSLYKFNHADEIQSGVAAMGPDCQQDEAHKDNGDDVPGGKKSSSLGRKEGQKRNRFCHRPPPAQQSQEQAQRSDTTRPDWPPMPVIRLAGARVQRDCLIRTPLGLDLHWDGVIDYFVG
jgi:hypothetical protein